MYSGVARIKAFNPDDNRVYELVRGGQDDYYRWRAEDVEEPEPELFTSVTMAKGSAKARGWLVLG